MATFFFVSLITVTTLSPFLSHAQSASDCGIACYTYLQERGNLYREFSTNVDYPGSPLTTTLIGYMCDAYVEDIHTCALCTLRGTEGLALGTPSAELVFSWDFTCYTNYYNGASQALDCWTNLPDDASQCHTPPYPSQGASSSSSSYVVVASSSSVFSVPPAATTPPSQGESSGRDQTNHTWQHSSPS